MVFFIISEGLSAGVIVRRWIRNGLGGIFILLCKSVLRLISSRKIHTENGFISGRRW